MLKSSTNWIQCQQRQEGERGKLTILNILSQSLILDTRSLSSDRFGQFYPKRLHHLVHFDIILQILRNEYFVICMQLWSDISGSLGKPGLADSGAVKVKEHRFQSATEYQSTDSKTRILEISFTKITSLI